MLKTFLKKNNNVASYVTILSIVLVLIFNVCLAIFQPIQLNFYNGHKLYLIGMFLTILFIAVLGMISMKQESILKKNLFLLVLVVVYIFVFFHSNFQSCDYLTFLKNWVLKYRKMSIKEALFSVVDVSNYTPAYNYFLIAKLGGESLFAIKYLTFLWSILLAFVIEKIINFILKDKFSFLRFAVFLAFPPILLEYAPWGQCDAIYTTLAMLAFLFALKKKSKLSFMFIGLSFAFKLQFLFIVPILFAMLIVKDENGKHYLKWKDLWIAPLMYVVNFVPALAGRSIVDLLMVYLNQSQYDTRISGTCGNFCYLFHFFGWAEYGTTLYNVLTIFCVVLTLSLMVFVLIVVFKTNKSRKLNAKDFSFLGVLFAFLMVFFMPKMLDRFYFIAMCLAIVNFFVNKNKLNLLVMMLVSNTLYFMMYLHFFIDLPEFLSVLTSVIGLISAYVNMACLFWIFYKDYCKLLLKKTKGDSLNE